MTVEQASYGMYQSWFWQVEVINSGKKFFFLLHLLKILLTSRYSDSLVNWWMDPGEIFKRKIWNIINYETSICLEIFTYHYIS